jgi:hypothetical protein
MISRACPVCLQPQHTVHQLEHRLAVLSVVGLLPVDNSNTTAPTVLRGTLPDG